MQITIDPKKNLKDLIKDINPDYQYLYDGFKDSKEKKSTIELATAVKQDSSLFAKEVFTLRDKNEYLAFSRWRSRRNVDCNRNGYEWDGIWWRSGVRKNSLELKTFDPSLLEVSYNGKSYKLIEK